MQNRLLIFFLLVLPFLFLGCTADSTQTTKVEAAEFVPTIRPPENTLEPKNMPDQQPKSSLESCPVTQPPENRFIPSKPYPEYPYPGEFWYGSDDLWTALPDNHTWPMGQKVFFWRYDYYWLDETEPELTVSAQRLDGEAPPATVFRATNGYNPETESFMLSGIEFPTSGCWEITGQYGEVSLTFVVWVSPE